MTRTRARGKRDVAWGFFYFCTIYDRWTLHSCPTKKEAKRIRAAEWYGTERGPIFRITGPTPARRGGGKK